MSDYEYTHEYSKLERTECEECGHAHWRERYEPSLGPVTKRDHEFAVMHRRFAGMFAGSLNRLAEDLAAKPYGNPADLANISKEPVLRGLSDWLPSSETK